jgi:hypothetical protein
MIVAMIDPTVPNANPMIVGVSKIINQPRSRPNGLSPSCITLS